MKTTALQIRHTEVVNDLLLIKWSDDHESFIPLTTLRDNCPCAHCAGETDVLGNVYIGPPQRKTAESYLLSDLEIIGYYALRPFWKDGHDSGIYTLDRLKELAAAEVP
ncbi:MAG: DUF971 domain-containing protein [FCB group bacterium]|nr:DUF971 domain-containing protein [FCB group bacterium]